jgi:uncharacterized FAD-dependent dehydrogenase
MLRLTEIKLPLAHTGSDLTAAILTRLGIAAAELISHVVYKRGVDARKKKRRYWFGIRMNSTSKSHPTPAITLSLKPRKI